MRGEKSTQNGRYNVFANAFIRVGAQAEAASLKCLQAETAAGLDALLPVILDKAVKKEL